MSRQNKVNPGQYTQRGRLTQDDAAREMMRQRTSIASQNQEQRGASKDDPWAAANAAATHDEPAEREEQPVPTPAKPRTPARPAIKAKAKAKAAKKTAAPVRKARATKSAAKPASAKSRRPARKAVLARSAVKRKSKRTARR